MVQIVEVTLRAVGLIKCAFTLGKALLLELPHLLFGPFSSGNQALPKLVETLFQDEKQN